MATSSDRASEIKAFDETKVGVKGLVDAGISKVPEIFIQPPEKGSVTSLPVEIPVIDFTGVESDVALRNEIVRKIKSASETTGFFQVINHGIPLDVLKEMLQGVKNFHEAGVEVKKKYYNRDGSVQMDFNSNFDLHEKPAALWRDTVSITVAPEAPKPDELPDACRDMTLQYTTYMKKVGIKLFELLSEALGLERNHLTEMECNKGLIVVGHYYPPCPEPHLTIGTAKHSDPTFVSVVLQDVPGLQMLYKDHWINVPPLPGALVVIIGDLFQLISNDKFKSVEHRVLASSTDPRTCVACWFTSRSNSENDRLYGPLKELITEENPPLYKETTVGDFMYYSKEGIDGQSGLDLFRL